MKAVRAHAPSAPYSCTKSLPFSRVRTFGGAKAARASIRARNRGSESFTEKLETLSLEISCFQNDWYLFEQSEKKWGMMGPPEHILIFVWASFGSKVNGKTCHLCMIISILFITPPLRTPPFEMIILNFQETLKKHSKLTNLKRVPPMDFYQKTVKIDNFFFYMHHTLRHVSYWPCGKQGPYWIGIKWAFQQVRDRQAAHEKLEEMRLEMAILEEQAHAPLKRNLDIAEAGPPAKKRRLVDVVPGEEKPQPKQNPKPKPKPQPKPKPKRKLTQPKLSRFFKKWKLHCYKTRRGYTFQISQFWVFFDEKS